VAGVLVGWIGEGWCFFLNGVSFFAVIAGLLMMKLPKHVRVKHDNSAWQHTVEGFKYVWQDKAIFILILMLGLMCMFAMPFSVLMPVIADKVLHGGPSAMGILMGMSAGGAFLGSLLLAGKKDSQGLERWIILGCIGCGFSLIAFALSTNLWLSAVLLVPVGLTMTTQMAASNTLIQMRVPDKLRGRVMSVFAMMFLGMSPFGSLLAGILAKPLGTPVTIALGGAACAIAGFACWKPARKVLLGPA
jgi:MFS family permease